MLQFCIKKTKKVPVDQLNEIFEAVEWGARSPEVWQKILRKSSFVVQVFAAEKLVGFGRIVEDGMMCMVYDITVHPTYQKQGIGALIMNEIVLYIQKNDFASVGLFAWAENKSLPDFYTKFGFNQVSFGMKFKI